jgi:hypothetical protein
MSWTFCSLAHGAYAIYAEHACSTVRAVAPQQVKHHDCTTRLLRSALTQCSNCVRSAAPVSQEVWHAGTRL